MIRRTGGITIEIIRKEGTNAEQIPDDGLGTF